MAESRVSPDGYGRADLVGGEWEPGALRLPIWDPAERNPAALEGDLDSESPDDARLSDTHSYLLTSALGGVQCPGIHVGTRVEKRGEVHQD